jgi:serine/threonine protein kinase HipA of HipAB toxin-antitoxin module
LAQRHRTGSTNAFDLLVALGRDCVGAIQLLPPDEQPTDLYNISGTPLSEPQIALLLRNATSAAPLGQCDSGADLRLSIAGAQEKTALLRHDEQWIYPTGSTPTTHIFKLPLGLVGNMQADMRTSIENDRAPSAGRHVSGHRKALTSGVPGRRRRLSFARLVYRCRYLDRQASVPNPVPVLFQTD